MPTEVTLVVPDEIYEQAEKTAQSTNREVPQVLLDTLVQALPAFYTDPRQPMMEIERQAFITMHPRLVEKFLGQYVAIYQGNLIDYDSDELALVDRIQEKYPDEVVLITEVLSNPERVLHFRSPRFIKMQ